MMLLHLIDPNDCICVFACICILPSLCAPGRGVFGYGLTCQSARLFSLITRQQHRELRSTAGHKLWPASRNAGMSNRNVFESVFVFVYLLVFSFYFQLGMLEFPE